MSLLFSPFLGTFSVIWCFVNNDGAFCSRKSLAPIPEDEAEFEEDDEYVDEEEEEEEEEQDNVEAEDLGSSGNDVTHDAAKESNTKSNLEDVSIKKERLPAQNVTGQLPSDKPSLSWQTIPKPKGHSQLDYSRWDRVEDDSSEEEDDDEDDEDDDDSQPQYRFRVKTVGVKAVK